MNYLIFFKTAGTLDCEASDETEAINKLIDTLESTQIDFSTTDIDLVESLEKRV